MKFKWEFICEHEDNDHRLYRHTARARVKDGWLVREVFHQNGNPALSIIFVPDANHEWGINE